MILEKIGLAILPRLATLTTKPGIALLQDFLLNEQAFAHARDSLREQYEQRLQPASFNHVVERLRLTRKDLIEYYRLAKTQPGASLSTYLHDLLRERLSHWVHNVPDSTILESLITDFFGSYEHYYLTRDSSLATLHLVDIADQVVDSLADIQSELHALPQRLRHPEQPTLDFAAEVVALLLLMEINFEVSEKKRSYIDVLITEPGTVVPVRTLLTAQAKEATETDIDDAIDRARERSGVGKVIFVTPQRLAVHVSQYADRRTVVVLSFTELRERLTQRERNAVYILGRAASKSLAAEYHVDRLYIDPDAVVVKPNEPLRYIEGEPRTPLRKLFAEFMSDPNQSVLLVLGDYGHGKSAWCARTLHEYASGDSGTIPFYIPLRHVANPGELSAVVERGVQLVSSLGNGSGKTLAILDGLDELPTAIDPSEKRKNVYRILDASRHPDKIVITARTAYFRGLSDFWELFSTTQEPTLWGRFAQHIPSAKHRPHIRAVMMHPFNNTQIDKYVTAFGEADGRPPEFAAQFLTRMKEHDPHDVYRRLARNPLYLFLFIMTEPWLDSSVRCSADIVEVLIKYWLERDLEKGQSRWLLRTQDRMEFMIALSWHMFERNIVTISFNDFEDFVWRFYKFSEQSPENASVLLDLQTTGLFGSSGGALYFALPAVFDYCVASVFFRGTFVGTDSFNPLLPPRIPSTEQARLWLGMLETRRNGASTFWETSMARVWCEESGVEMLPPTAEENPILVSPVGILYGEYPAVFDWPVANKKSSGVLRTLLNYALSTRATAIPNQIRVRIANKYGLHGRPSAEICKAAMNLLSECTDEPNATLEIRYNGLIGSATNIMHVMLLAAECGAVVQFVYAGCARKDVEVMLHGLNGRKTNTEDYEWELSFGEELPF